MSRCQFPANAPLTAYKRGCRCPRCFAAKQQQTRAYVRRNAQPPFTGCVSQSVIDEWARRVWDTMSDSERRVVREVL